VEFFAALPSYSSRILPVLAGFFMKLTMPFPAPRTDPGWDVLHSDRLAIYVKNSESRSVPMNAVLRSTLQTCRMIADAAESPVFRTPQGTPYKNFRTAFEHAVAKVGIADFTFPDLRHTFASRLVMLGVDLPTVQALMGHKTIAMTLRYTHLTTDHKHRAVRLLESVADKVLANFTTVSRTHENAVL
jgi:integrase